MQRDITKDEFECLLQWLDPDREKAGLKYEEIRHNLLDIFLWRGFSDAEELADETINRVTRKFPELKDSYEGDPSHYFYGVAKKVALEAQKRKDKHPVAPPLALHPNPNEREVMMRLLDECLTELSADNRHLILGYYKGERTAKINNRKQLGNELRLSQIMMRQRVHRLRTKLKAMLEERWNQLDIF
ncbi:MAG TPA: hypothetical protein VJT15_18490 [Pyrinomonadaceae bacterium]|nr:hypothetical protein [Pyrinomonadaceae bacterium]